MSQLPPGLHATGVTVFVLFPNKSCPTHPRPKIYPRQQPASSATNTPPKKFHPRHPSTAPAPVLTPKMSFRVRRKRSSLGTLPPPGCCSIPSGLPLRHLRPAQHLPRSPPTRYRNLGSDEIPMLRPPTRSPTPCPGCCPTPTAARRPASNSGLQSFLSHWVAGH
jgi:hypothetical protein